ncbi:MAG: DUF4114 domain-containing protein [Armatimonadetes bacterium]|nr:DUF4114 domain-containing protein [Armatimonadota bacterium]
MRILLLGMGIGLSEGASTEVTSYHTSYLLNSHCSQLKQAPRPFLGARLIARGGEIQLMVQSAETLLDSEIHLLAPDGPRFLISNRATGKQITLGHYPAGTEIVLGLRGLRSSTFFVTGPCNRNPDGVAHNDVLPLSNGSVLVGFEDMMRGGDEDYDDAILQLTGVHPIRSPACPKLTLCYENSSETYMTHSPDGTGLNQREAASLPAHVDYILRVNLNGQVPPRPVMLQVTARSYLGPLSGVEPFPQGVSPADRDEVASRAYGSLSAPGHSPLQAENAGRTSPNDAASSTDTLMLSTDASGRIRFRFHFGREHGLDLIRVGADPTLDAEPAYAIAGKWIKGEALPAPPSVSTPDSLDLPRTVQFVDALPRMTMAPSVRNRTYRNGLTERLYPSRERLRPHRFRLSVRDGNAPPSRPVRLRISLLSADGGAGHAEHPGPRAHGWLFDSEDGLKAVKGHPIRLAAGPAVPGTKEEAALPPVMKTSLPVNPESPVDPQNSANLLNRATEGHSVKRKPPGEVRAVAREEPGGELQVHALDVWTDPMGDASFVYLPPEISGVEQIRAEALRSPDAAPVEVTIAVRHDGLISLQRIPDVPWKILREKHHQEIHWAHPQTADRLATAARLYAGKQAGDRDLQRWILSLKSLGYEFPYQLSKNRVLFGGPEPLFLQASSLPWGGLLDPEGDYASPAWGHRDGKEVDLMTRHLVRGDPLKATPAQALGDPSLEDPPNSERIRLLRQIQFRRLRLMIEAVKEAGGQFLPEEAGFFEGEHLHVSFADPIPTAQEQKPAPGPMEKPVAGPGGAGLTPANPARPTPHR